ncbi:MAG: hypothetical protein AAFQ36_01730 [Pseudomonadota bacterium]
MIAFSLAAALSLLWFGVHLFMGGRDVAAPLRASDLDPVVRDTSYLCWHLTSCSLLLIAVFFGLAAFAGEPAYAVAGTLLSTGFAVVGIAMTPLIKQSYAQLPQGWLFVPVTGLGLWALVS